jgi:hypothetical protein
VIFEQFIDVLLDKVERDKLGVRSGTGTTRSASAGNVRPDRSVAMHPGTTMSTATGFEGRKAPSRHIPSAVKRAVWFRDRAQCAFVADTGQRCTERGFLELHHIQPYALDGPSTVGNIALRCRRHNQYEAEIVFGAVRV